MQQPYLEAMHKALVIRNYADKTVSTYVSVLGRFLSALEKPLEQVVPKNIQDWQYHLDQQGVSWCSLPVDFLPRPLGKRLRTF